MGECHRLGFWVLQNFGILCDYTRAAPQWRDAGAPGDSESSNVGVAAAVPKRSSYAYCAVGHTAPILDSEAVTEL